jgi:hypothetical protein
MTGIAGSAPDHVAGAIAMVSRLLEAAIKQLHRYQYNS